MVVAIDGPSYRMHAHQQRAEQLSKAIQGDGEHIMIACAHCGTTTPTPTGRAARKRYYTDACNAATRPNPRWTAPLPACWQSLRSSPSSPPTPPSSNPELMLLATHNR